MSAYPVPPGRLETQLPDKKPLLSTGEAMFEANRCLYCHDAPCIKTCPTSIDIPTFIRKIATQNLPGSARTILSANLLGASCARVCPVEVLCESTCVYVGWGRKPIPIGRLQRYAMTQARPDLLPKLPPTGHSVGVIGAGPASLACAGTLALLGHEAIIYEKHKLPGGLNATGVAPYKFRLEDNLDEVQFIQALGAEIRTGVEVGADVSTDELLERHEALFLGPGLGADSALGIPGEDGEGVVGATTWIRRLKTEANLQLNGVHRAVVVGGGNTAVDASRELAGLGIPSVTLVYRRARIDMKAYDHELSAALKEGVELRENAILAEVLRQGAKLTGVRLQDQSTLQADLVVVAIGQAKLRALVDQFPGVSCDDRGRIIADPQTFVTGNPRVFTGGDAMNGGLEVVNAVHDGQAAARSIDSLLRSKQGPSHA